MLSGLHVLLQMFRAPSLTLQKQNDFLQNQVSELTLKVAELEGQFSNATAEVIDEDGIGGRVVVHVPLANNND